jgi:uncharacterized protein (TIGR03083 family)
VTTNADEIESALSALSDSHDRLVRVAKPLAADEVAGPSYCSDWSIAQVLSHLGSGAEIFGLLVEAGLHGREAPGQEQNQEIWATWDAKSPQDQARDGLAEDAELVEQLASIKPDQRLSWRLTFFGSERDLGDVVTMRLSEHILHTWDIEVLRNPQATLAGDAAGLVLDLATQLGGMVGKPQGQELKVHVTTEHPERNFQLAVGADSVSVTAAGPEAGDGEASLWLPAEAFVRLLAGRLDAQHPVDLEARGVDLEDLRAVFVGF